MFYSWTVFLHKYWRRHHMHFGMEDIEYITCLVMPWIYALQTPGNELLIVLHWSLGLVSHCATTFIKQPYLFISHCTSIIIQNDLIGPDSVT